MATQILPTGIKNFGSTTIDNIVLDTSGGVDIDDGHLVVTHGGNVTVDSPLQVNSTLNVTGNATLGGTLTVTGNVNFDNNTLYIDVSTNRVGIGTNTPTEPLTIVADSTASAIGIRGRSADSISEILLFASNGTTQLGRLQTRLTHLLLSGQNNTFGIFVNGSTNYVGIGSNSSPAARLSVQDGNLANGSMLVGANYNGTGMNQNSDKLGAISFPMYQSDTYPQGFRGIASYSSGAVNFVQIGGGTDSARAATDILFYTAPNVSANGSERMRINSSGHVGIGTDNPVRNLNINAEDPTIRLEDTRSGNKRLELSIDGTQAVGKVFATQSATQLAFGTANEERMRIDSLGRLLVGTSSALTGTNSQYSFLQIKGNSAGASTAGQVTLARNLDSESVVSGHFLGRLVFADQQAGEYAYIEAAADATPGVGDYPGRLVFSTTADGASSPTQKLRIDSVGTQTNQLTSDVGITYKTYYQKNIGGLSTSATPSRTVQVASYDFNGQYTITVMGKHSNQSSYISAKAVYVCGNYTTGTVISIADGGYEQTGNCSISWSATGGVISVTVTTSSAAGPSYVLIGVEAVGTTSPQIYREFDSSQGFIDVTS